MSEKKNAVARLTDAESKQTAKRIASYDESLRQAFQGNVAKTYLIGAELLRVKETMDHGEFAPWVEEYLPTVSPRSCNNYMKFADELRAAVPKLGKISDVKLIGKGALAESTVELVSSATAKFCDGRSITDLYRALGVVRTPKPPGGFRPDKAALAKWLGEQHPQLQAVKFDDLPPEVQRAFKAAYRRQSLPPEQLLAAQKESWGGAVRVLGDALDRGDWLAILDDRASLDTSIHLLAETLKKLQAARKKHHQD